MKRWVTARRIPHQRSGDPHGKQQRGVWFTWADIRAIGDMLPELVSERQAKRAAAANAEQAARESPTDALVEQWAKLGLRRVRQQDEAVWARAGLVAVARGR